MKLLKKKKNKKKKKRQTERQSYNFMVMFTRNIKNVLTGVQSSCLK